MSRKAPPAHYTTGPVLSSKAPVSRSRWLVALVALGFLILAGRAAYIQVWAQDFYVKKGEVRYARTPELPANRGRILERNGQILASSTPAQSAWVQMDEFAPTKAQLQELSKALDIKLVDLKKKLKGRSFVWLRRQMDEDMGKRVAALKIKGLYLRKEYRRQYPEGESVSQVVGITNIDQVGREGIERAYEEVLSGKAGSRRVIKDRLGRVIEDSDIVAPQDGQDVYLSIDSRIQFMAYQKLRDAVQLHNAKSGSLVMLDAQTGEVLALANYPSFDPNRRGNIQPALTRNSAVMDMYEPGSSMKPITVSLALSEGRVTPQTVFATAPGYINVTGSIIRDTHSNGDLTVGQIIQKSSNVGTVKISQLLDSKDMWDMLTRVGFGQKPALKFPSTTAGRLRNYKSWRPVEKATISYGYGVAASLLQMAQSYTIFTSDGYFLPATLEKQSTVVQGERVLSSKDAKAMRQMMYLVTQPGGTAKQAAINGYSVGGKTGTVHKLVGGAYAQNQYSGFFVGFAPVDSPRVIAAVMIDDPKNGVYYGGAVAGPVFSAAVQQALQILQVQPDLPMATAVAAKGVQP
ncbi:MAG: penicillin-binding protein 2 [Cellvibrionales bacterium]|nr:MAG: penicillin-binding protein 2 [Cellvibrionales bacterium]